MNYQEALDFIHGTYKFGSKLGLENIKYLLELLGNPQEGLRVIHIAGTNGKGSTSAYLHSILKHGGYRVGLYTSPYLETFTERIQINGVNIPEESLGEITAIVKEIIDIMVAEGRNHPTEFEVVTAIAFYYFAAEKVDYLVLEVGLGGRLDATNVVEHPLVSVITPIGFDHMQYLGDTLDKIAFEKGGIIKENSITVIYPQESEVTRVLDELCQRRHNQLIQADFTELTIHESTIDGQQFSARVMNVPYDNVKIKMLGRHQINNCCTALWVVEALKQYKGLKLEKDAIYEGLSTANWPGRLEVLNQSPLAIIDGAHNTHGAAALKDTIQNLLKEYKITLVIGMLEDKDVRGYLELIIPYVNRVIATKPDNPRAMEANVLAEEIKGFATIVLIEGTIEGAVHKAFEITAEDEAIIFAGSLYMIGEARKIIRQLP